MIGAIQEKLLGNDPETGLNRYIQITNININAYVKVITIDYCIALLSPTGIRVKVELNGTFTRYNKEGGAQIDQKYDLLEATQAGNVIRALLMMDLDLYPNVEQL